MKVFSTLIKKYEAILENQPKKVVNEEHKLQKLEVGVWFLIDRDIIESKIKDLKKACEGLVTIGGMDFFARCLKSLTYAKQNPDYYTTKIETYIFEKTEFSKTEQQLRDMCYEKGDGQTDEVVADLELMMRFCNGESLENLINKSDTLPRVRVITLLDGGTGYLGGGVSDKNFPGCSPADLYRYTFVPTSKVCLDTTSAFRRVLKK